VLDDFGTAGRTYRETDESDARFESAVNNLLTGQFNNPVRVVAFNAAERWSGEVSEDVSREAVKRAAERSLSLSTGLRRVVARPCLPSPAKQPPACD
jgi:hypothetical protein